MKLQMTALAILLSSVVTANAGNGWNFFEITVPYHNDFCWELQDEVTYNDLCNPKDSKAPKVVVAPTPDTPTTPKDDDPVGPNPDGNGGDTKDDTKDYNGGDTRDNSDSNGDNSDDRGDKKDKKRDRK